MSRIKAIYSEHRTHYLNTFPKIKSFFEESRLRMFLLRVVSKYMTWGMYGAYAVLLVWLISHFTLINAIKCVVIPFAVFIVTTVVRDAINAPRPYELSEIQPVFPKSTKGHSCPSRHTACAFAVALAWCSVYPPVGVILCLCAVLIASSRSAVGVHFPLDVLFGAFIAFSMNIPCIFLGK